MREKSPRSNLRKRLLILRKKLERTASFPKKLFLGISPRRLILPPNSLRVPPAGGTSKPLLPPAKNHEVQFGGLCLKMREPFLKEGSATFLKFILSKFLENANNATPPRRRKAAATPKQNFLLHFLILRAPIFFFFN